MLAIIVAAGSGNAAVPTTERNTLLTFYSSTSGFLWTNSTGWATAVAGTECSWYGITCNADNSHVVGISLAGNFLFGTLSDLTSLTSLEILDLRENHLSSLGAFAVPASLRYADFFANQLVAQTPPPLAGLVNLEHLDISSTVIGNGSAMPTSYFNGLSSLKYFNASNNILSGSIPPLTALSALEYFDVSDNSFSGTIPVLTGLTHLHEFDVSQNLLGGTMPSLSDLTELRRLDISNNGITGSMPLLDGMASLQHLVVSTNGLSGSVPSLANLHQLKEIRIDSNLFTGAMPNPPAPNQLIAGGSALCPNMFSPIANSIWNTATGVAPWYTGCDTDTIFKGGFEF